MEAIKKDELFDEELRGMVKFTDTTMKPAQPVKAEKKAVCKEPVREKKAAQKPTNKPMDAEYEPVKTWYDEKTVNMVKWAVVFIGLEYLVFYWQQTGQMQDSAAIPCMVICALLAGLNIGNSWRRKIW
jgi:hypothetical protein